MSKNAEVKCPNCKEVFKVDDSVYTDIVKQVRDQQFQDEIVKRLEIAEKEKQSAIELTESKIKGEYQELLAQKNQEISDLKLKSKEELVLEVTKKEDKIRDLQSQLENAETQKKLEVSEALKSIEKERDQLKNDLKLKDSEKEIWKNHFKQILKESLSQKNRLLNIVTKK